ncbi:class I SAM-dependent methyltransferase [Jannaschia seohaensis]|uniref:Methyltransferase domain-containing protein n=1 Tax=Jannaschia seohaensis TaxID=475081 RepID=A0A2Y9BVJ0_9RHOB|nr:methyltransferase domain-containing protein [Jannaschia seohaensis]PWJ21623.1 methyltransferase family protein [Jannaschia seohaensis]SSA37412.1 Methyltransferase domain-containing protein [Jannaschia seohaensis]
MDARLQLRVQRYGWDAAAPHYHESWEAQLRPAHDRLLDLAGAGQGQRIVETACGSGLVTMRLAAQVGPDGQVLATDLSEQMVRDLRMRLARTGMANVETARMAAESLDIPDAAFDMAICALGLMYTPDPGQAVAEMARVVRPGGTVAATVWGERRNCGWAEVFPIVDARVASDVCPLFFGTGGPGSLARLFEAAGLVGLREHRHAEVLVFGSDAEVTDAVLLGGPVALAVKRFGAEVWEEVRQEFLASVAGFRQADGSYRIPGEFVTVTGRKRAG